MNMNIREAMEKMKGAIIENIEVTGYEEFGETTPTRIIITTNKGKIEVYTWEFNNLLWMKIDGERIK